MRCPITYELTESTYSRNGLNLLSRNLGNLNAIEYSAEEQRHEAALRATRLSIQGVQPKLSAVLNIQEAKLEIVDIKGKYIIKPQHHIYPQLPENEDLTIKLAAKCGIITPIHGMIYSKDGSLSYFIKRFDRSGKNNKLPLEDFAQLAEEKRETKYDYSIEKLIRILDNHCTFPQMEKSKFFKRFLFNFLVGNEDMHLKNYSLITRNDIIELSPAYDFLNTSIVLGKDLEESALSLAGKKKKFNRTLLIDYLGIERLKLNTKIIANIVEDLEKAFPFWFDLIEISFLNQYLKNSYAELLKNRMDILKMGI